MIKNFKNNKVVEFMKNYLKLISFFSTFTEQELDEFCNVAEIITTNKNDFIIKEDEESMGLFFIVNGEFNVLKKIEENKYKRLKKIESGDFFGEMSILNNEVNSASVISEDDGTLIHLSCEAFQCLIENNVKLSFIIMKKLASILSERLRYMNLKYGMSVAQLQT